MNKFHKQPGQHITPREPLHSRVGRQEVLVLGFLPVTEIRLETKLFKQTHLETLSTTRLSLSSLLAGLVVSSMKVFILLQMSRGAMLT